MRTREQLLNLLNAATDALRSYEMGNSSPDLAKEVADFLFKAVEEESKSAKTNDR
jgi:hypothetical protein